MAKGDPHRITWSARYPLMLSLCALLVLGTLTSAWAVNARISGAVIGKGTIKVAQTMTTVQHPVGGVVEEIRFNNGDQVRAGDILVRLEDKDMRSELSVIEDNLFEVLANIARLEAILDDRRELVTHALLDEAADERPAIEALLKRQRRQLDAHYASLAAESRLLDEQVTQVRSQIDGLEAQIASRETEMSFIVKELERLKSLADRQLLKQDVMFNTQKMRVTVSGEIGRLEAHVAELRGKISEINLKRHTIKPKASELAVAELSKLRPERTKLLEQRATLLNKLSRLEIRAPISGRIHDIQLQGVRSVVVAAKTLMKIVPDTAPTFVAVQIRDTDIDQVHVGQIGTLKFKAFSGRNTPLVTGEVKQISADVFTDPSTRKTYYEVILVLPEKELAKLDGKVLLPGMPVDAFLSTESRTPINYVLRPLLVYFDRAFRDV